MGADKGDSALRRWPSTARVPMVLQRSELGQQALHQNGRTEHVKVLRVQESGNGMGDAGPGFYTVSVLDGPPLASIPGGTFVNWPWAVGG